MKAVKTAKCGGAGRRENLHGQHLGGLLVFAPRPKESAISHHRRLDREIRGAEASRLKCERPNS